MRRLLVVLLFAFLGLTNAAHSQGVDCQAIMNALLSGQPGYGSDTRSAELANLYNTYCQGGQRSQQPQQQVGDYCSNGNTCPPGSYCSRVSADRCIQNGLVDCGNYSCQPGQRCTSDSRYRYCLGETEVDCGSYHCSAGNKCSRAGCIPETAVACSEKSYCNEGTKCGSGNKCLARDTVDCGGGRSCPAGNICVKGGAECLTKEKLAQRVEDEKKAKADAARRAREAREAEEFNKKEKLRLAKEEEQRKADAQREAARIKEEQRRQDIQRQKAEEERKIAEKQKAELEAKQQLENRLKLEAEAKRKVEETKRLEAEALAHQKANEAKHHAIEAELNRQAEAQAKQTAALEAKQRAAEVEAKRKADEAARAKAIKEQQEAEDFIKKEKARLAKENQERKVGLSQPAQQPVPAAAPAAQAADPKTNPPIGPQNQTITSSKPSPNYGPVAPVVNSKQGVFVPQTQNTTFPVVNQKNSLAQFFARNTDGASKSNTSKISAPKQTKDFWNKVETIAVKNQKLLENGPGQIVANTLSAAGGSFAKESLAGMVGKGPAAIVNNLNDIKDLGQAALFIKQKDYLSAGQILADKVAVDTSGALGARLMPLNPTLGSAVGKGSAQFVIDTWKLYGAPVAGDALVQYFPNVFIPASNGR